MGGEGHFVFDKRRFPRVLIDAEVDIYSVTKVLLGKGKIADISASGVRIKTDITQSLRKGLEIFLTFTLPEGPTVDKLRSEIKGIIKSTTGQEFGLRFTEFRALDVLRNYVEKKLKK